MNHINLPFCDLRVSDLCLGCGDFGGSIDRASSYTLLDRFVELGGNFLDTAHVYNDWIPGERSRSEKVLGNWMHARRNREDIVLATKGGHPGLRSMHIPRLSPQEILGDLDDSLVYLQTDVIDLYWLHRDDPSRPVEEIIDLLANQVKAGKIRYFGASNWSVERLRAANEYAARAGKPGFLADQVMWNAAVVDRSAIPDPTIEVMSPALWEYHRDTGIAAIPYTSQANGFFHKMELGKLDRMNPGLRGHYPLEPNRKRFAAIQAIRAQRDLTVTQVVLAYLLSQPFPTVPIIGPKTISQLEDSLSASGIRLTTDQLSLFPL